LKNITKNIFKIIGRGSGEEGRIALNIGYLGVLQALGYILPLLTFPYLTRVLGPQHYGLIVFAGATTAYFGLLADYGFNLSATRQASVARNNSDELSQIYSSVLIIKIILLILGAIVLYAILFNISRFRADWQVYLFSFIAVVGNTLFPLWLFQGLERMKYITIFNVGARATSTILIFFLVRDISDYLTVPIINGLATLAISFFAMVFVQRKFGVVCRRPTLSAVKLQLSEGRHIFISSMATSLYTTSATFFLGIFSNNVVVGYFSAADRIVQAVKMLYAPIGQAIYPFLAKSISDDKESGLRVIRALAKYVGGIMFVISLFLLIFSEPIINFAVGSEYIEAISILRIMAFLPFLISLSNVFGIQTMLNLGQYREFTRIIIFAAILGVCLMLVLVPAFGGFGAGLTLVVVECFVTLIMFFFLRFRLRIWG
jgi:PST family polysaccharide transporter